MNLISRNFHGLKRRVSKLEPTAKEKRYTADYKPVSYQVLSLLELFGNLNASLESRKFLFSAAGYLSCTLDYDDNCQYLKDDLRTGRLSAIGCEELIEILRLNHMIDRLDVIFNDKDWPHDKEFEACVSFHPQWRKIEKQALKTLELLRK